MWQHHDLVHAMRMEALRAEAERERRWRLHDELNGRPPAPRTPSRARTSTARAILAMSRAARAVARRLDERVVSEMLPERRLGDA